METCNKLKKKLKLRFSEAKHLSLVMIDLNLVYAKYPLMIIFFIYIVCNKNFLCSFLLHLTRYVKSAHYKKILKIHYYLIMMQNILLFDNDVISKRKPLHKKIFMQ